MNTGHLLMNLSMINYQRGAADRPVALLAAERGLRKVPQPRLSYTAAHTARHIIREWKALRHQGERFRPLVERF